MGFTLNQLEQERQIRKLQKKDYEQLSNLPKINNVELKGDKTTSDLGINADNVMMPDGEISVEEAIGEVAEGLSNVMTPNNLLAGTISPGDTILSHITSRTLPIGISIWYTQNADDSPYIGTVSFTIINKPALDGRYSCAYMFSSRDISYAEIGSTIPQALTWNRLT